MDALALDDDEDATDADAGDEDDDDEAFEAPAPAYKKPRRSFNAFKPALRQPAPTATLSTAPSWWTLVKPGEMTAAATEEEKRMRTSKAARQISGIRYSFSD